MATVEELLAATHQAISTLEQNATALAAHNAESLEQPIYALQGGPEHEEAAQAYNTLTGALREAQAAEQQLREVFERARGRFQG